MAVRRMLQRVIFTVLLMFLSLYMRHCIQNTQVLDTTIRTLQINLDRCISLIHAKVYVELFYNFEYLLNILEKCH